MSVILRKNFEHNNGFSMVEVIVASLIFAVAAVGLIQVATLSGNTSRQTTGYEVKAAFLAKSIVDDLQSAVSADTYWSNSSRLYPGTYTNSFENFNITTVITADAVTGGRLINVTVDYPDL